ncbi:MAG: TraB/VirB10 family protein [Pseudomonadota bacterium]
MSEFADTDIHANKRFANRQRLVAFGLIGVLFAAGLGYVLLAPSNPEDKAREAAAKTRLSSVDPRDAEAQWVTGGEARLKFVEEQLAAISSQVAQPDKGITPETAREIEDLRAEMLRLQQANDQLSRRLSTARPVAPAQTPRTPDAESVISATTEEPIRRRRSVQIERFEPTGGDPNIEPVSYTRSSFGSASTIARPPIETELGLTRGDVADWVPTNAYAPATFLVTVDMPAGSEDESDPLPVLLRITGPAKSVLEDGAPLRTNLTGCQVNGAATPDLSSERVYIRLQKMTCLRESGEVVETAVEGYVAQFGKVGVRGRVIRREGAFIKQALLASFVGGFGEALGANTQLAYTPYTGTEDNSLSPEEIFRGGIGGGLSSASDRIADFLIEQAEDYDSVIELPAGVAVELVFVSGSTVRDLHDGAGE